MTPKAQREAAALRRLKKRIYQVPTHRTVFGWIGVHLADVISVIDAWHEAERKRGGR